jgi:hypothetical protein
VPLYIPYFFFSLFSCYIPSFRFSSSPISVCSAMFDSNLSATRMSRFTSTLSAWLRAPGFLFYCEFLFCFGTFAPALGTPVLTTRLLDRFFRSRSAVIPSSEVSLLVINGVLALITVVTYDEATSPPNAFFSLLDRD